jgi:hypothetical protein
LDNKNCEETGGETLAENEKHTGAAGRRLNELRKLELRKLAAERNFRRRLEAR